jgi:hypothetical protein
MACDPTPANLVLLFGGPTALADAAFGFIGQQDRIARTGFPILTAKPPA